MNNEEFSMKLNEIKERVLSSSTPEDESKYTESLFESIKHIDKQKNEFWYARELQAALEYKEWRNFTKVIDRAITACENSENAISPHFVEVNKIVSAGVTTKSISDYKLLAMPVTSLFKMQIPERRSSLLVRLILQSKHGNRN